MKEMRQHVKAELKKRDLTKKDVKDFCDGLESDAEESDRELCGALAKLAKKGKKGGKGKELAQLDEDDLPSKKEVKAALKQRGISEQDVKGFCDGVDSDADEEDKKLCGALAMIAKKGGKGKELAQMSGDDLPPKEDIKEYVKE